MGYSKVNAAYLRDLSRTVAREMVEWCDLDREEDDQEIARVFRELGAQHDRTFEISVQDACQYYTWALGRAGIFRGHE